MSRPTDHIVWQYPEGMDLQTCLRNLHSGKCWCGNSPLRGFDWWACSAAHRTLWWRQFEFWQSTRLKILRRDKHQCQECGNSGTNKIYKTRGLQVDHIVPIKDNGAPWDKNNMRTLCEQCHARKTGHDTTLRARKRKRQRMQMPELMSFSTIENNTR